MSCTAVSGPGSCSCEKQRPAVYTGTRFPRMKNTVVPGTLSQSTDTCCELGSENSFLGMLVNVDRLHTRTVVTAVSSAGTTPSVCVCASARDAASAAGLAQQRRFAVPTCAIMLGRDSF
eukprot:1293398-Rhodomonas_salina.1